MSSIMQCPNCKGRKPGDGWLWEEKASSIGPRKDSVGFTDRKRVKCPQCRGVGSVNKDGTAMDNPFDF